MAPTEGLWPAILEEIQRSVRSQQFDTWFRNIEMETCNSDALTLRVPNNFYHEWLKRHYLPTIQQAVLQVTGQRTPVEFIVRPQPASAQAAEPRPVPVASPGPDPSPARPLPSGERLYFPPDWTARLNRNYTFDNFVVGTSNGLAHAAALAITENSAQSYNPLFLHGVVGIGKTHLVQAITHHMLTKRPPLRLLCVTCESFMYHYVSSIQHNEREKFRQRYRSLDMLLIDDIHFLCRGTREMTQEEFFHTFNALYNAGKQIVLSSDSPPQELTKLEERLLSRFKWGLVARIDPPTYETRVAILKKKARLRGRDLPDDVVHFVAENIDTNIRELEGALTKITGYASVVNRTVDLALAQEALSDTIHQVGNFITMDDIIRVVTAEFHVKLSDLQSKRRSKSLSHPRQIAMYLARVLTQHSLSEIGGYFGGRDHTTVMHACEKIARLKGESPDLDRTIERLTNRLRNPR